MKDIASVKASLKAKDAKNGSELLQYKEDDATFR